MRPQMSALVPELTATAWQTPILSVASVSKSRVRLVSSLPNRHFAPMTLNVQRDQELAALRDSCFENSHSHAHTVPAHEIGMLLDRGCHVSLGERGLDRRDVVVADENDLARLARLLNRLQRAQG